MSKESKYSFRVLTSEDEDEVMELLKNMSNSSNEFLVWKYKLNPDFDPSFAVVAINNGQIVGCTFWVPRCLKISKSTAFRATFSTDAFVHPDHRGHGIGRNLVAFENKILENKKTIINYSVIKPDLAKHLQRRAAIGLVALPASTLVYKKYLNCSIIKEKVSLLNTIIESNRKLRAKLTEMNVRMLFRLRGFPSFLIKIGPDKIHIEEDDLSSPDLKIESDFALLTYIFKNKNILNLVKALLMRKIKFSGNILRAAKLYTIFNYLRQAHVIDIVLR